MTVTVDKTKVILTLRCQACGASYDKEVETFSFGVGDTVMYHSKHTFIHECSENNVGIAQVRGGRYKLEVD